ncbi:hypothetical protein FOL47_010922 [Perkinsus chesapeaki]|uniref:folate gamma-glutamyl hydrolase n=1 Tax=Perkinsus chesapeaki TaxID=330153 RepID=A0A7J6N428_PERCH|nr:hypothetical protein FOL47_010922 [Perkinsus chesapeaki]
MLAHLLINLCIIAIPVAGHIGLRGLQGDFPRSPVVGILAHPPTKYVPHPYILEYNDPNLKSLLASISGVLFTGGSLDQDLRFGHPYVDAAKVIYDYAVDRYAKKDPFPIFGICQGHQLLALLAAGTHEAISEGNYTTNNVALPIKFVKAGGEMLKSLPRAVRKILETQNVTANIHSNGVPPEMWKIHKELRKQFKMTSTSEDPVNHKIFSASMESRLGRAPMYSVEFHPEMVSYVWHPALMKALAKTAESVLVANSVVLFIGKVFRDKPHRFKDSTALSKAFFRKDTFRCPTDAALIQGFCLYNISSYSPVV